MYKKKPKEIQMEIACSASRVVDVHVSSARYEAHLGGPSDHGVGGATQRCKHDDDVRASAQRSLAAMSAFETRGPRLARAVF
jgi:hypothetical protein